MIVAKWKTGFGLYDGINAQTVAEELRAIGDEFSPAQIVDAARDESTELHKCFEWDDTKAAELYRLKQARNIVQALVIEEQVRPKERPEIRVFYKPEKSSGYMETKKIVRDEDAYANLLAQARQELRIFKAKYNCLVELQEIMELID